MQCEFGQIMNPDFATEYRHLQYRSFKSCGFQRIHVCEREKKRLNYDKFHFQIHNMLYNFINAFCIYRYTDIVTTPPRLQMTR